MSRFFAKRASSCTLGDIIRHMEELGLSFQFGSERSSLDDISIECVSSSSSTRKDIGRCVVFLKKVRSRDIEHFKIHTPAACFVPFGTSSFFSTLKTLAIETHAPDVVFTHILRFFYGQDVDTSYSGLLCASSTPPVEQEAGDSRHEDILNTLPWREDFEKREGAWVHKTAIIGKDCALGEGAILWPFAVLGHGVVLGARSQVMPHAVVGRLCRFGEECTLGAHTYIECTRAGHHVSIRDGACIGQSGFGFVQTSEGFKHVPQIGEVIIEDDVDIGPHAVIERGALEETRIGRGTKIGSQVHIGHGVRIGSFCLILAQSGVAGSVTIGDGTLLAAKVGIADHLTIGSKVQIAALSGVKDNIPDGERWVGVPAKPVEDFVRREVLLKTLQKMSNFGVFRKILKEWGEVC